MKPRHRKNPELLAPRENPTRFLEIISEASRKLGTGDREKKEVISQLLKALAEILEGDLSWVAIQQEKSGNIIYPYFYRLSFPISQLRKIPPQSGITWWVIKNRRPRFVADYPSRREAIPDIVRAGMRQLYGFPLNFQGRTFGMIGTGRLRPGVKPSPAQITSAEILGNVLAATLGGSYQIQEEQKQKNELRTLRDIALVIASEPDLDRIFSLIIRQGRRLLGAESGGIGIWDEKRNGFTIAQAVNIDAWLKKILIPAHIGTTALILKTQRVTAISNYQRMKNAMPEFRKSGLLGMIGSPIRVDGKIFGIIAFGTRRPGRKFGREEKNLLELLAEHASVAIQNARFRKTRQEYETRLHQLSQGIISAQEEERRRIARELHDEHGQAVALIKLRLDHLNQNWGKKLPPPVRREIAEVNQLLARNIQDIRRLITVLRPSMLDDLGLVPTLRWWLSRFQDETGIETGLSLPRKWERLPGRMETAIYRIIQESLTNAARHSAATRVQVSLEKKDGRIMAEIEDNGIGFRVEKVLSQPGGSVGLMGIEERVALLGGKSAIKSQPGKGARIRVELPLPLFSG
ncbi:MAG: GAF domain-containing protein [Proteobacteria bacterium]|nr:GAF domain-containing protein [Pseudomonadota bacterium]